MKGVVMEGEVTVNGEEFVDGVHMVHARRVLLITVVAACASAIGVLPLLLMRRAPTRLAMGRMLAMACGILLTACGILVFSAVQKHALRGAVGSAVGVALVLATRRVLNRRDDEMLKSEIWGGGGGGAGGDDGNNSAALLPMSVGRIGEKHLEDGSGRRTVLTLLVMAIYGSVEGMGVGVSFGGGEDLGNMVSAAVMLQNLPEGLLCGLLLLPRVGRLRALLWTILVHLGQPIAPPRHSCLKSDLSAHCPCALASRAERWP